MAKQRSTPAAKAEHAERQATVRITADVARLAARLSKEELAAQLIDREKAIARQVRALAELRHDRNEVDKRLRQYAEIDRVVNTLARLQARKAKQAPTLGGTTGTVGRPGDPPQNITQPRALADVLARLADAVDELPNVDEIEKDLREEFLDLESDRGKMLALLNMDEHDWRAIAWRL